jgi:hypothetical protein
MPFILNRNTLNNLDFRKNYQDEKKVNLQKSPSLFGLPTLIGGTDLAKRKTQIAFLEKMRALLKINTYKEEQIRTTDEFYVNLDATRIMFAACLYVKDQITSTYKTGGPQGRSTLYTQINEGLCIVEGQNDLDENDRQVCFEAARRVCATSNLDNINKTLKEAKLPSMSFKEWSKFINYLNTNLKETEQNKTEFPITCITQKFFGITGTYVGASIGYVVGDVISRSTSTLTTKTKLTALIGGALVTCNYVGPTAGLAIFAPAIAEQLINAFLRITLAHGLSVTMSALGQGVGTAVGLPLDLTLKAFIALAHYSFSSRKSLTGIRLCDGKFVVEGVLLEEQPENELSTSNQQINIEIQGEQLYINGELIDTSNTRPDLLAIIINDLYNSRNNELVTDRTLGTQESSDLKEVSEAAAVLN